MPVTIVVGGQFGSEGKGKVVALIAHSRSPSCVVRCGGPNSGHTTLVGSRERVFRQLPASVGVSDAVVAIAAGAVIDEEVLVAELTEAQIDQYRLVVDPRAIIVSAEDKRLETSLVKSVASTGSGNGQALSRRLLREHATLAGDSKRIASLARVEPVASLVHDLIDRNKEVIVEGTQGFGLSLLHGPHFPFVTSKDTTAASFAMEVGLSPRDIDQIVMVVRTFPIRVGGESGPLFGETSWEEIRRLSGAPTLEQEYTSVTRRVRRVGMFDFHLVKAAVKYNKPTSLAVMGLDRLDFCNRGASSLASLTDVATQFLTSVRSRIGIPLDWVGTGFGTFDAIAMKDEVFEGVADVR